MYIVRNTKTGLFYKKNGWKIDWVETSDQATIYRTLQGITRKDSKLRCRVDPRAGEKWWTMPALYLENIEVCKVSFTGEVRHYMKLED